MRQLKTFLVFAGLAICLASSPLMASTVACPTATLDVYTSSYGPGFINPECEIGGLGYKKFEFFDITPNGTLGADKFVITPSGLGFSIKIPEGIYNNESYLIVYEVDPAPILGGEELSLDGGFDSFAFSIQSVPDVVISKWACPQGNLDGNTFNPTPPLGTGSISCNSLPPNSIAFMQVGPGQSDSAQFATPVSFTSVLIMIQLNGSVPELNARTEPQLVELEGVPEPSSMALLGGGLVALAALRRRKK